MQNLQICKISKFAFYESLPWELLVDVVPRKQGERGRSGKSGLYKQVSGEEKSQMTAVSQPNQTRAKDEGLQEGCLGG